jgi:hypothetical protein
VGHLRSGQTHARPLPERVGDLGDLVDPIDQRPEPVLGNVAGYFDLVPDLIRNRRLTHEVSAHLDPDVARFDAGRPDLAEEVVGDAPGNREIQQLPAV